MGIAGCMDKVNHNVPLLICIFVVAGTANTVTNKVLYDTVGTGRYGIRHEFEKPYALNFIMFLGMALCLIPWALGKTVLKGDPDEQRGGLIEAGKGGRLARSEKSGRSNASSNSYMRKARLNQTAENCVVNAEMEAPSTLKSIFLIFWPALCDCIATILMSIGLLWTSASVWQMFRGAITFFTALLRVCFGLVVYRYEWCGILIVTTALCVVGVASINIPQVGNSDDDGSSGPSAGLQVLGMGLIVVAQLIQALQTVLRSGCFTTSNSIPP